MHITTPTAALPRGRGPHRPRKAAIAPIGIVSAVMVAAGVAIGGGKPMPHAPATTAGAPALPAHLHEHSAATSSGAGDRDDPSRSASLPTGNRPAAYAPAVTAGLPGLACRRRGKQRPPALSRRRCQPARMTQKGSTMKRIILTAVAAAAVLTGGVVAAAPAFASNSPQQFVTHEANHPDTTSLTSPAPPDQQVVVQTDNGPVWAWDDLSVKLTPTQVPTLPDGANYQVKIDVTGSFA